MKPLISLIIPVYNVEKFLPKCMETVLTQTYENFEVILVDDGSTDGSRDLCDKYAKQDFRVVVFHKPNGGLADARNYGVQHAKGDYISMIDSDDYITEDYLSYLYELMERHDADLARAGSIDVYDMETRVQIIQSPYEKVLDAEEALKRICYTSVGTVTTLYKREILLKHPYPKGRLYEDLATTCKIVGDCRKIAFSDKILYFWVIRNGSIMHSKIDERQYDVFWAADEQLEYIKKYYPRAINAAKARCVNGTMTFLSRLFTYKDEQSREHFYRARNYVRPYIRSVLSDRNVFIRTKICCLAILLGYFPTSMLYFANRIRVKWLGKTAI